VSTELSVEEVCKNSQGGSVVHNKDRYPKTIHADTDSS